MAETETVRRIQYIDGLRAIAVLGVVVFHLGIGALPNGFLGVDVFFVISGFVITRSLSRGEQSRILPFLEHFYRRRFWRLFPPLVVVVIASLAAVALFVPPVWIARHILFTGAGAVTGTSNIVLTIASGAGYFDSEANFNPFLHTWSLGVEEQFYLIYPLVFWLVAYLTRRGTHAWSRWIIPVLGIGSFVLSAWLSATSPTFAFYMLPTRFWELAAGAVAFQLAERMQSLIPPGRVRIGVGWGALVLVIGSFFGPASWVSPLPAGVAPVLATMLLLWFAPGGGRRGSVERWLSARPVTYVGRISYSMYLWHWPIIVLLRWTTGISSPLWIIVAVLATFALAIASYHLIEQPFQRARFARWALPSVAFVLVGALVLGGVAGVFRYGANKDFVKYLPTSSVTVKDRGWNPKDMPGYGPPVVAKVTDPSAPELLIYGDSHAGAYEGAATFVANELGMRVKISTLPNCGFDLFYPIDFTGLCSQQAQDLAQLKSGDVVVMAALRVPRYNDMDGIPEAHPADDDPAAVASRKAALEQAQKSIRELQDRGVKVVFDSPAPVFEYVALRCADWYNQANPVCGLRKDIPKSELKQRSHLADEQETALMDADPGVLRWDVFDVLCPGSVCHVFDSKGHNLYTDTDHLSGWGNERVAPSLQKVVEQALATPKP